MSILPGNEREVPSRRRELTAWGACTDYPCYELYSSALRGGIFSTAGKTGRQLHLVVGRDRRLRDVRRVHGS
jgi:hypothetical protein